MDKITSNKRKSLASAEEAPYKIQKTNSPVSQKKKKIKKTANKNQKEVKEKTKQIVEDELSETRDNLHDAVQSNDEADSVEKPDIDESVSDKGKKFGVNVSGLDRTTRIQNIFEDCNILKIELMKNLVTNKPNGRAFVFFKDKNSQEKALEKNQKEYNNRIITVTLPTSVKTRTDLCVYVKGIKPYSKITDIFKGCNIDIFKICRNTITNKPTGRAYITFKDKESVTKALEKNGTRYDGYVLTVEPSVKTREKRTEFKAFVKNLSFETKVEDLFNDCNIHSFTILRENLTNKPNGMAVVFFNDEESLQKALLKHETEYDFRVITVLRDGCSAVVRNLNVESNLNDLFNDCNIQWIDLIIDKKKKKFSGTANINFKDKESLEKALLKNKTEYDGKTIKVELYHGKCKPKKSGNSVYLKSISNSYNPGNKMSFMKKKILLGELKNEAQKLEREINRKPKPFNKRKQHKK